jgi:hypothetical protein
VRGKNKNRHFSVLHFSVLLDLVAETMINTQVDGACGGAPV